MTDIEKIITSNNNCKRIFYNNEPIFKEGDRIEGVYFIKKGKAKVTKCAKINLALWFADQNEFLGISSFFNESQKHTYSTYAFAGNVEALFISNEEFIQLLTNNPYFKQEIIQALCNRIYITRMRIFNIKTNSIKQRFLDTILFLLESNSPKTSNACLTYSIDELSELTGTTKQYIQKLLKEFHQKNLIENLTEHSMVVNIDKLPFS